MTPLVTISLNVLKRTLISALPRPSHVTNHRHLARLPSVVRPVVLSLRWTRNLATQGGPSQPRDEKKTDGRKEDSTLHESEADKDKHYDNLQLPVSFPGSPGGQGGAGGGGLFRLTKSPLFDAALTTFIGLGMGECMNMIYVNMFHL